MIPSIWMTLVGVTAFPSQLAKRQTQDTSENFNTDAYVELETTEWELGSTHSVEWNTQFPLFQSAQSVDVYLCNRPTAPTSCISICQSAPNFRGVCVYSVPDDLSIMDGGYFILVTPRSIPPSSTLRTNTPGPGPSINLIPENIDSPNPPISPGSPAPRDHPYLSPNTCITVTLFGGVSAGIVVVMGILWLISILYLQRQLRLWIAAAIAAVAAAGGRSPGTAAAAAAMVAARKTDSSKGRSSKFSSSGGHPGMSGLGAAVIPHSMTHTTPSSCSSSSIVVTEGDTDDCAASYRRSRDSTIFV